MTFTEATAQQLAWERARDTPNAQDKKDAEKIVEGINFRREVIYGLEPIK